MKKRTKVIIGIGMSLLILVLGGLGFAGNYFYTLAIDAHSDKSVVFGNEEEDPKAAQALKDSYHEMMARDTKDVWMKNKDGYRLHAYEINQTGNKWIIVVHGYISEAKNMAEVANHFAEQGYRVLVPDLRSHGQSEGDSIGMGAWDSEDIVEWTKYILKQDSSANIALYGVSMGASTVMMASGNEQLPKAVKVAVEDCGYTSAWDEFSFQLDDLFGLPSFPALDAANLVTKLRAGYDLRDADAVSAVKRKKIPMLFIHGDSDDFVPTDMVYPLFKAAAGEKELMLVKGAGHGKSREVDPLAYWEKVDTFLEKYI